MLRSVWIATSSVVLLLPLARADDGDLAKEFRSARTSIITQMRDRKRELRPAAVRKLAAYPLIDAAKVLMEQGLTSADENVRQAAYETLLEFKDRTEICAWLQSEVSKDLKKGKLDPGSDVALSVLLASTTPETEAAAKQLLEQAVAAQTGRLLLVTLVDRLASSGDDTSFATLLKLKELAPFQSEFGPRRAYVQALIAFRKPAAVTALLEYLTTLQGEVRAEILMHLSQISDERFAKDEQWAAWWKEKQATFEFPAKDKPRVAAAPVAGAPSYYGLPLYGSKIVFVLDTSGSMRGLRIEAAKRELMRAISELPDGVRFNVVAFNSRAAAWQRDLVPSSRESKEAAMLYVLGQDLGQGTASYDALEAALTFDTESIYFLTDGAPFGGKLVQPAEIVSVVSTTNRVRRVTINSIGIGVGPSGNVFDTFLKTLSRQNFGAYRRVDE